MNFEQFLKSQGLNDEQIKTIIGNMEKNKFFITNQEGIDDKYKKLIGEKEDVDGQLKEANKTIETLKKDNKDNEALQNKIKDHENTIETLKKDSASKIKNLIIDGAIDKVLGKNNAKYPELLSSKFDREKLVVSDEGKVSGIDEQLKSIKETFKDLFEESVSGKTPNNPDGGSSSNTTFDTLLQNADNMTAEEVAAQFTEMNKNN